MRKEEVYEWNDLVEPSLWL